MFYSQNLLPAEGWYILGSILLLFISAICVCTSTKVAANLIAG